MNVDQVDGGKIWTPTITVAAASALHQQLKSPLLGYSVNHPKPARFMALNQSVSPAKTLPLSSRFSVPNFLGGIVITLLGLFQLFLVYPFLSRTQGSSLYWKASTSTFYMNSKADNPFLNVNDYNIFLLISSSMFIITGIRFLSKSFRSGHRIFPLKKYVVCVMALLITVPFGISLKVLNDSSSTMDKGFISWVESQGFTSDSLKSTHVRDFLKVSPQLMEDTATNSSVVVSFSVTTDKVSIDHVVPVTIAR